MEERKFDLEKISAVPKTLQKHRNASREIPEADNGDL